VTPVAPPAGIAIERLTREGAEREADALLALGRDLTWDDWTPHHLLDERPGKWELSLVARRAGEPVAYAISSRKGNDVHLHHIVVAAQLRGSGLGRSMLDHLRALASIARAARITLKVYRDNPDAVRFYEREGFAVVDGDESLVTMAVPLEAPPAR
jgi:ribosomal protein S18 acetylase RimI-like enzyme